MNLQKRVALITGAAHRVGKAIALGLAKEGMKIALHFNQSQEQVNQTLEEIKALGAEAFAIQGNFADVAQIKNVVKKCQEHFKQIDVLINNAAIYFETPVGETSEPEWDDLLAINLKAPYFCAQYVSDLMKQKKRGKIINITDVAGISPWPEFIPYSASKAGLIAVTKGLAKALAPNIQVNAIASGTILMSEDATEEYKTEIKDSTLLKKLGTPEDIVNAAIFLLKGSDFITGEVVVVDGGGLLV
jgi:NAD(P)-dependent dehydrogenase (short-subunit alcohol dehydrogenase family)